VKKVGGYPIEKTPQSQELPPPSLEMPTILASARGHGVLAFAKVVSTSNIGLESKGPPPWRDGYLRTAEKSIHGFYIPLYGSGFIFDSVLEIWGVDELDRKLRYSSRGQKTIADSPKVTISVSSEGSPRHKSVLGLTTTLCLLEDDVIVALSGMESPICEPIILTNPFFVRPKLPSAPEPGREAGH